jgi:plastocyanin
MRPKAIVCIIGTMILLAGCGNGDQASVSPEGVASEAPVTKGPVDESTAGVARGSVRFVGTPPRMSTVNMSRVPDCAALHDTAPVSEPVLVGADGALQNVVVYLQGDFSRYAFPEPASPVTVDQRGCVYIPRVVGLTTGTTFRVLNSDPLTHNVNVASENNPRWNKTQTAGGIPIETIFTSPEVSVVLRCNLHPWMRTYVAVFDHPYFQVTGSDGAFRLDGVPPGTYTVTAWHERFGMREQTVTLRPDGEEEVALTFTADGG